MKVFTMKQGSPEWFAGRLGYPTASQFHRIITPRTGKLAAASADYIAELIAERLCPQDLLEKIPSREMLAGTEREPEARRFYELEKSAVVQEVGYCLSDCGRWISSVDGLVEILGDEPGCLEIKSPTPKTHVSWLLAGGLPDEHRAQCHGHIVVTRRLWCDFLSYAANLPPLLVRVWRDDFTDKLEKCLIEFDQLYQESLAHVVSYGFSST